MICPKCGKANNNTDKFCSGCGGTLSQTVQDSIGHQTESNLSGNSDEFYKTIIGPRNQDYYLRHFTRFALNGKSGASWNWSAFFAIFYWFTYRKMWGNAFRYFYLPSLIMILVLIAAGITGRYETAIIGIGYILCVLGILFLPPMYANALYYKHCKKKIVEMRLSSQDMQRQLGELSRKGGTSYVALVVQLPMLIALASFLTLTTFSGFAYYTLLTRTTQAYAVGTDATKNFANYYDQHQQPPADLAQAGFTTQLPQDIKSVTLDSRNSTVTVTMTSDPIAGNTLLLSPSLDANGRFIWKCTSQEGWDIVLPRECRKQL